MKRKTLGNASAVLLIGTLSMLFAEVFSGASQTWYITGWGWLITFPLYLAHVLFFLWLAMRYKKMSLHHLYLFGVIFGLYESWITKVLWKGYMDSNGPGMGTFLGVGVFEFPILIFFWHPVMSFILPVLVFECLTGVIHVEHVSALKKTKRKTVLISIFLILVSAFIASGNGYDLVSSNLSIIGTVLLAGVFYQLAGGVDVRAFKFGRKGITVISIYLAALYLITFVFLLPERIPTSAVPYLTILVFYLLSIVLIQRSRITGSRFVRSGGRFYGKRDLLIFAMITLLATNVSCLIPQASSVILILTYLGLIVLGTIIFVYVIYKSIK